MNKTEKTDDSSKISRLANRHIGFIALGGAIGTGLFLGAGGGIITAGPSVILAYILGGLTIYVMLRCQAEMTIANPATGNFSSHVGEAFGRRGAFIAGWAYVILMLVVSLADTVALTTVYLPYVFPNIPPSVWAIIVIGIITAINVSPVRVFGEVETVLTVLKVWAVLAIIVGGLAIIVFGLGNSDAAVSNLWAKGGVMPNGLVGFSGALAIALFAFGGTETIGFAAADSDNVEESTKLAVNTVPVRIGLFYILSVMVLMVLVPWNEVNTESSPFVTVFEQIGFGWASTIMNVIVVLAALSAVNALIYAAGRMVTGLADMDMAPQFLIKRNRFGTPVMSIVSLVGILSTSVIAYALIPDGLFLKVAMVATVFMMFSWLMIIISQLKLSKGVNKPTHSYLVPIQPYGQYFAIGWILIVLFTQFANTDSRPSVIIGLIALAVLAAISFVTVKPAVSEEKI